jgi:hypothetical protein
MILCTSITAAVLPANRRHRSRTCGACHRWYSPPHMIFERGSSLRIAWGIRQEFFAHQGRYGSPRLHAELRDKDSYARMYLQGMVE